jgi:hypothetical protein
MNTSQRVRSPLSTVDIYIIEVRNKERKKQ